MPTNSEAVRAAGERVFAPVGLWAGYCNLSSTPAAPAPAAKGIESP